MLDKSAYCEAHVRRLQYSGTAKDCSSLGTLGKASQHVASGPQHISLHSKSTINHSDLISATWQVCNTQPDTSLTT